MFSKKMRFVLTVFKWVTKYIFVKEQYRLQSTAQADLLGAQPYGDELVRGWWWIAWGQPHECFFLLILEFGCLFSSHLSYPMHQLVS